MLPSFFREAEKASHYSDHPIKMGACILLKGRTIAVGFNQRYRTHPFIKKFHEHQTLHAEVSAILKIKNKKKLKGSTIVIFRESKDTKIPLLSKPCPTCMKIINIFKIKKIIYTVKNGFQEEILY